MMRFREGTPGQKVLFFSLIGVYLLAVALTMRTNASVMGQPFPGVYFPLGQDSWYLTGYGQAATERGLGWGYELLEANGVSVSELSREDVGLRTEVGQVNVLKVRCPFGEKPIETIELPVTAMSWLDVVCYASVPYSLGLLFLAVGVVAFLLRPYEAPSWALLSLSTLFASFITMMFRMTPLYDLLGGWYVTALLSMFVWAPLHVALTSVVPHPLLTRRAGAQALLYLPAIPLFAYGAFAAEPRGFDPVVAGALIVTTALALGRAMLLAVMHKDRVVRQRARLVLVGCIGFVPPTIVWFAQTTFEALMFDMRVVLFTVLTFPLAVSYIIVKNELISARVAVRRSVAYAIAAAGFIGATTLIISLVTTAQGDDVQPWVTPVVLALVLVPTLHFWPGLDCRINQWLYPKRSQYPELMQRIGEEMATCTAIDGILGILAATPEIVCDARCGAAFLLPTSAVPDGSIIGHHHAPPGDVRHLAQQPLIHLMVATRREIHREHIAVQPQYANIKRECYATLDALGADVLLPIVREHRVIGALAIGGRPSGDPYDTDELGVLRMIVQQAVQAIMRSEAFHAVEAQRQEMADLKRVFPPHVIDQVMAKGGVAEFPSQRKMVTVFFSDLRGFTAFSDSVEPEEVSTVLAEYHRAMGLRIDQFGGTLERFAGDGIMVFFNDPMAQPDHVQRAVRMALAMREDVQQLRDSWVRKGYHLDLAMGVHTGFATCGFVGYEGRRDYAVIGNVTNMAARLCDAAGGGEIFVTARVISELGRGFDNEPAGELTLKGFREPQLAYRILGAKTHV